MGNLGNDGSAQREQAAFWLGRRLGLPTLHRRHVLFFENGNRKQDVYEDAEEPNGYYADHWWPEGQDGDLYICDYRPGIHGFIGDEVDHHAGMLDFALVICLERFLDAVRAGEHPWQCGMQVDDAVGEVLNEGLRENVHPPGLHDPFRAKALHDAG